jgi:NDP-sugar pyrophosphorylase family protein
VRAVILAGGLGTRLQPYTTVLPKPLMPIGDQPILEVVIRQLVHHGIEDVVLAVGHLSSLIEAYFGDGRRFGARVSYSSEPAPLGTAGPLAVIPGLDEPFLVMNGDILTTLEFGALIRYHRQQRAVATLAVYRKRFTIDFGVLTLGEGDCVTEYSEKPTLALAVSTGIYVMEPDAIRGLVPGERQDLPNLIRDLMQSGRKVAGYVFDGCWLDIGRHDDYSQAVELMGQDRRRFLPE